MNQPDDDLFRRLEAELATDPDAPGAVDLDKPRTRPSSKQTADRSADSEPFESVYLPADSTPTAKPDRSAEPAPTVEAGEWVVELPDPDRDAPGDFAEGDKVDPPADHYPAALAEQMRAKDDARRPVIAPWLRSKAERHAVALWTVNHYWKTSAFHAVRCPYYTARLLGYAPRGLARAVARWSAWLWDKEGQPVRAAAVAAEDTKEYLALSRQRDARVRLRAVLSTAGTVAGAVTGLVAWAMTPEWAFDLSAAVITTGFGVVGSPDDRPIVESALVQFRNRKLTSDVVSRAFAAAGLVKKDQGIAFPQPIRQDGQGWLVVVDLPFGKTFADAQNAHQALASGLDVSPNQVFLDKDKSSARRVRMWVANEDPLSIPVGRSPLIKMDRVDFWKPFPWGRDERGNEVTATMLWLSMLVGAVPRQGKSFSARTIALAAALDPYVRLVVFDGKASPDWRGFAKVAHRVGFGIVPKGNTDPVRHLLAALEELKADVEDRYHRLSELPLHLCPEGKLTPELSRDKKLNMPLTLVVVDEVQEYLLHPELGKEILALLVYLVRVAPAVGVSVMLATQKPDDKACPSVLRDQHQARFSLRVGSWQVSDVILGAGSYSEGLDASRLERQHKGVGLLKGMNDEDGIVRTYLADGRDAEAILARAAKLREQEGTLSGDAVGETPAAEQALTVLEHVDTVWLTGEDELWSETVVDLLAQYAPDLYGPWGALEGRAKADQLSTVLKPFGVTTKQIGRRIDGKAVTRRGITRVDIRAAITQRNENRVSK